MPEIGEITRGWKVGYKESNDRLYIWQACVTCGKERWVAMLHGKPISLRCRKCTLYHREPKYGPDSNTWKGGRVRVGDYIIIKLSPDDFFYSMANMRGYVLEHRLVVAKALGRCLHRWEIVHHKGARYSKGSVEDKQDNRYPENLQLVTDDRHSQITILENKIKELERKNRELAEVVKVMREGKKAK